MAARQARLTGAACAAAVALSCALAGCSAADGDQRPDGAPRAVTRIVSLVPALTEMLFAIGAGGQVVGVSSFDSFPPEVQKLPRVGALLDPDTERILALRPDLVTVYGSQTELRGLFEGAGIRTFSYRHAGITGALTTLRELGAVTGHTKEAEAVGNDIRGRLARLRAVVQHAHKPRVLLVFERTPQTLRNMYVSGGSGFLNEMLHAAGGVNVFDDVKQESVQPSHETLLARAPDVILEVRARGLITPESEARERDVWSAVSSLPAVRNGRIHFLGGEQLVVPGPRLAEGAEMMARTIHPELFR